MSPGEPCVPHIGGKQSRARRLGGAAAAAAALVLLLILVSADAPRLWRVAVAIPAWFAAVGFLQSREKT